MDTDLPLLDHDRIARAAEGMISNHGRNALAEALRRAQTRGELSATALESHYSGGN